MGVGASEVRGAIANLAASSEAGLLLTFASYGLVPGLLLVWYILTALVTAVSGAIRRSDDRVFYCLAAVVAVFCAVQFLGSSTSFTDWLAMVVLSTAVHLPLSGRGDLGLGGQNKVVTGSEDTRF